MVQFFVVVFTSLGLIARELEEWLMPQNIWGWREWQLSRPHIGMPMISFGSVLFFLVIGPPIPCSLLLSTSVSVKFIISLFAVKSTCCCGVSRPQIICKFVISYESALVERHISLESVPIVCVVLFLRLCGANIGVVFDSGHRIVNEILGLEIERSFFIRWGVYCLLATRDSLLRIYLWAMNKVSLRFFILSVWVVGAIFGLSFLITVRLMIWLTIYSLIVGIMSWLVLLRPSKLPKIIVSLGIIVTWPFISLHVGRLRLTRWLC